MQAAGKPPFGPESFQRPIAVNELLAIGHTARCHPASSKPSAPTPDHVGEQPSNIAVQRGRIDYVERMAEGVVFCASRTVQRLEADRWRRLTFGEDNLHQSDKVDG